MPKLVVGDRQFDITPEAAEPLVKADILYWDDAGESEPKEPHLRSIYAAGHEVMVADAREAIQERRIAA